MEVILIKDVEKLGFANDIVNVAPGYANNFLVPQGHAKFATPSAKKVLAENLKQQQHKEVKLIEAAEKLVAKIEAISLTVKAKAEDNKIFGSVTSSDLADALKAQGIEVDRKNIVLDAVKSLGEYEASVRIYKTIRATIKFTVEAAN